MPNALSMFKGNLDLQDCWLEAFDTCAVGVQGNLVIMTPNMSFVPMFHHFEEENVQACADGRFGAIDCFQWPQAYDPIFCNLACIPRKEAFPFLHPLHWAWLTPTQEDFQLIPGNSFPVGTLTQDKVAGLESLRKLAEKHVMDWKVNWPGKNDATHPLTFRNLLIFIADAQCLFLEIYSFMEWIDIAQPHINSGKKTFTLNSEWMGAFALDSDTCNKLYIAGVPVWYVRSKVYIPSNMNVKEPVLLTHPDQIVLSKYVEGNRIRPYEIIYRGKGGYNHQLHIRCLYGGMTFKDPEPGPSSGSFSVPGSSTPGPSPLPSAAGKAPQKHSKKKHGRQPYEKDARPTHPVQSGEFTRDKWKDPESPYLPPSHLCWDHALNASRMHLLLEHLQGYIATWLVCRPLWIGRVDHDPPHNYPSLQLWRDFLGSRVSAQQAAAPKGKGPEKKGPTAAEKHKRVMKDLFGDDVLDTRGDLFAPEGTVEFHGEQIPVASLTNPPQLLTQKITWELFELGFRYELRDLDRYMTRACWVEDPVGREQLLHVIFPGEAGLVMWSEPFPTDNYGMWNNTLIGVVPYLKKFRQLLSSWDNVLALLTSPLTMEGFTGTICWEVTRAATVFYVQTFFDHFGRPPVVPHLLPV